MIGAQQSRAPLLRRALDNQDLLLLALAIVLMAVVVIVAPGFLHIETLFNIVRSSMVSLVFSRKHAGSGSIASVTVRPVFRLSSTRCATTRIT